MRVTPGASWEQPALAGQRRVETWTGEIFLLDMVAMLVLPLERLEVPGLPFVLNDLAVAGLAVLASVRAPRVRGTRGAWIVWIFAAILVLLTASMYLNGPGATYTLGLDGRRRILHLALLFLLVLALATGRIHARSAAVGITAGVTTATLLAFVKIGGDAYPGRLTGFFGDPNVAGLILTVLGPLIIGSQQRRRRQVLLGSIFVVAIVMTQSRTALFSAAVALGWRLIGRRTARSLGMIVPVVAVWAIATFGSEYKQSGSFADRAGSDWLRDQLLVLENAHIAAAPWYGTGPNTAFVSFGENIFLYHSSYLAARAEGGWPLLVLVLAAYAGVFWSLMSLPTQRRNVWMESSATAVLGMALYLGDVFLSTTGMVFLGLALHYVRANHPDGGVVSRTRRLRVMPVPAAWERAGPFPPSSQMSGAPPTAPTPHGPSA